MGEFIFGSDSRQGLDSPLAYAQVGWCDRTMLVPSAPPELSDARQEEAYGVPVVRVYTQARPADGCDVLDAGPGLVHGPGAGQWHERPGGWLQRRGEPAGYGCRDRGRRE